MEYGWIWVAIIAVAIIVEILTEPLIAIWFVPGAVISIVLDYFKVDILVQIAVFLAVSAVGIFISQNYLRKFAKGALKTNIEAIIGEKCIVTEKIDRGYGIY